MKVVAYSVRALEKEYFAKANKRKHDITLIANPLDIDTVHYAEGKEAIIMPQGFVASKEVMHKLYGMGISYIMTRPTANDITGLQEMAEHMINELDSANNDQHLQA